MDDAYLIRDAIVRTGNTRAEKAAAIAALGALLDRLATAERDLAEARAALMEARHRLAGKAGLERDLAEARAALTRIVVRHAPGDGEADFDIAAEALARLDAGEASPHD